MLKPRCLVKARGNLLKNVATDESEERGKSVSRDTSRCHAADVMQHDTMSCSRCSIGPKCPTLSWASCSIHFVVAKLKGVEKNPRLSKKIPENLS